MLRLSRVGSMAAKELAASLVQIGLSSLMPVKKATASGAVPAIPPQEPRRACHLTLNVTIKTVFKGARSGSPARFRETEVVPINSSRIGRDTKSKGQGLVPDSNRSFVQEVRPQRQS